jgi:spore germination protein YaaH
LSAFNSRFVSGWVPYWNSTEGRAAYTGGAGGMFAEVSPFNYSAQADGSLAFVGSAAQLSTTVSTAHANGITVLATVTDGTGPLVMAGILTDPAARANHIANLVALATSSPAPGHTFDGVDLDYEGFAFSDGRASWPTTEPNWRAFIFELAGALHDAHKLLSVTIPPVWTVSGTPTGYSVYDQAWLATYADRVRLMVYDWSTSSPGPISPMSWLSSVIAYTNSVVDPSLRYKLQLGVPAYGRDWGRQANSKETCPDGALTTKSVELQNVAALAASRAATPKRDGSGEMTFTYDTVVSGLRTAPLPAPPFVPGPTRPNTIGAPAQGNSAGLQPAVRLTPPDMQVTCTVRHFVYYPDEYSIQDHAKAALAAGWSGIVIWALGYEIPEVYYRLAEIAP